MSSSKDLDARPVADDMGVHREQEQSALGVGAVELPAEHLEHTGRRRVRPQSAEPVHGPVRVVVADPLHGQFHDAGRLVVLEEFVGIVVRHQRRVVEQTHFPRNGQGVRRKVPRWRADAYRSHADDLLELVGSPHLQIPFVLRGQRGVPLVDPGVNPDLVPATNHRALLVRVQHRGHCRHEEGRRHGVSVQQLENSRHADACAVLALTEPTRRRLAGTERQGLVIRIEGQRHRATRPIRPRGRLQRPPRTHLLDNRPPARLGPRPRLIGAGVGRGHRRAAKKACSSAADSSARTPPDTLTRWFRPAAASTQWLLTTAPAFGSSAPKINRAIRA